MIDKKTFKNTIAVLFGDAGFVKKGQSWCLDDEEILIVVNLEKIDFFSKEQYVINVGFWLKAFGKIFFPPYHQCHLYYRVERLFPGQRELILQSCSLNNSNAQLLENLRLFIENQLIPFLYECTKEENLRHLILDGALEGGFVRKEARMYLTGK